MCWYTIHAYSCISDFLVEREAIFYGYCISHGDGDGDGDSKE